MSWVVWAVLLRKFKLVLGSFAVLGILIVVAFIVVLGQLS
jgi:hypothetical protein